MYATHEHIILTIIAEHRQLSLLTHSIERLLKEAARSQQPECVQPAVQELQSLRRQLEAHFLREESEGFMDEALAAAPRFNAAASELMHQHPKLLAELDRVLELAGSARMPQDWAPVHEAVFRLFRDLRLHEAGEDRILHQVFPSELDNSEEI